MNPSINEITDQIIERMAERNAQLRRFALRLLDPEDLGHTADFEIRNEARKVLGMKPIDMGQR
jgi:hypothetical protein